MDVHPDASTTSDASPGGRRSERARHAVLAAAERLFASDGWHRLTIEAIAQEAGVGKATIYRWWSSKAAVLMDAMLAASDAPTDFPDTGDALEDLRTQLRSVIAFCTQTPTGCGLLTLIAESQHDPALADALSNGFIARRRADARIVLRRGRDRGDLRPDLDLDLTIDAVYGAVYYRLLVSHEATDPDYADDVLNTFAAALRTGPASA